jgi:hypothetical protein
MECRVHSFSAGSIWNEGDLHVPFPQSLVIRVFLFLRNSIICVHPSKVDIQLSAAACSSFSVDSDEKDFSVSLNDLVESGYLSSEINRQTLRQIEPTYIVKDLSRSRRTWRH